MELRFQPPSGLVTQKNLGGEGGKGSQPGVGWVHLAAGAQLWPPSSYLFTRGVSRMLRLWYWGQAAVEMSEQAGNCGKLEGIPTAHQQLNIARGE